MEFANTVGRMYIDHCHDAGENRPSKNLDVRLFTKNDEIQKASHHSNKTKNSSQEEFQPL